MPLNMLAFTKICWKQYPKELRKKKLEKEFDLSGFICPLSKMKATELIDNLDDGETVKITLGDTDSLKSVAQELKTRDLKPSFQQESENRFVLIVTR